MAKIASRMNEFFSNRFKCVFDRSLKLKIDKLASVKNAQADNVYSQHSHRTNSDVGLAVIHQIKFRPVLIHEIECKKHQDT